MAIIITLDIWTYRQGDKTQSAELDQEEHIDHHDWPSSKKKGLPSQQRGDRRQSHKKKWKDLVGKGGSSASGNTVHIRGKAVCIPLAETSRSYSIKLWRSYMSIRQCHARQEEVVAEYDNAMMNKWTNSLFPFLLTVAACWCCHYCCYCRYCCCRYHLLCHRYYIAVAFS